MIKLSDICALKRLESLKIELEESGESLIDSLHGHGSQSLTNLMLCGIATSNVFDGDKCLEGLVLHGTPRQSTIGFLTIMEYLRYCEVSLRKRFTLIILQCFYKIFQLNRLVGI